VLEAVLSRCDALESRWSRVEQACDGVPSTLVHGDFRPKNAHVRIDHAGMSLLPMDWEEAGWGGPAADLARVDLAAYWAVVRDCWPSLDLPAFERLANVGGLFRWLAAMHWDSPSLASKRPEVVRYAMANMRVYQAELAEAIQQAGLAN
jgi:aminoglycoside phosphotransferase (APT) family kinase protein